MPAPRVNRAHNPRPFNTGTQWSNTTYFSSAGPNGLAGYARATAGMTPSVHTLYTGSALVPVPISIWVRTSQPQTGLNRKFATVTFQNAGGSQTGGTHMSAQIDTAGSVWTKIAMVATPTGNYERILVQVNNSTSPVITDIAQVMIGAEGDYLDGDLPDAGGVSFWWNGVPYQSPSSSAKMVDVTPDLDDASVLIEVNLDPSLSPTVIYDKLGRQIHSAQNTEDEQYWTGWTSATVYGQTAMTFRTAASTGTVSRPLGAGATIVGRQYRVAVTAQRGPVAVPFGVAGSTGVIPAGSGTWVHEHTFTATATTHTITIGSTSFLTPPIERVTFSLLPVGYTPDAFTLTRTDANGTRPVRLLERQEIMSGALVVVDYEAAMTGPITYQLTTSGTTLPAASTTLDGSEGYRLAPAVFPQFATTLALVTGYDAERSSGSIVHHVIGRADPVVRLAPLRLRAGTLTVWCEDYPAATAVHDVYRRGEVVLLRQPDHSGFDLYHVATHAREGVYIDSLGRWMVEVTFVEQKWPRGPLLGTTGWTWDDLLAVCATWDDVARLFPTWNAAQIGIS